MKGFSYIVLLCAIQCFEWSTQDKIKIRIPASDVKALPEHAVTCEKETGVPAATLKLVIDWPLPNDEATKKFFHCVSSNIGYADKDGHAVVDVLGALKVIDGKQEDYVNHIKECNKQAQGNNYSYDAVFAVGDCIHKMYVYSTN